MQTRDTGWLGIASVWASGSHITQGTVKLNDTYFNTAKYNTPAWRNMVSCQEVGPSATSAPARSCSPS